MRFRHSRPLEAAFSYTLLLLLAMLAGCQQSETPVAQAEDANVSARQHTADSQATTESPGNLDVPPSTVPVLLTPAPADSVEGTSPPEVYESRYDREASEPWSEQGAEPNGLPVPDGQQPEPENPSEADSQAEPLPLNPVTEAIPANAPAGTDYVNPLRSNHDDSRLPETRPEPLSPAESQSPASPAPADHAPAGGHDKGEQINPVKENEPLFKNWPRPDLAFLISGEQLGYIEPCGCAGLENQKGGLSRRFTLIKSLAKDGWPVVAADLGGQVKRFGTQSEIKFRTAVDALTQMGYGAIGFGPQDLRLPTEQVMTVAANLGEKNPLVCANVGLFEFDNGFVARYRVVEAGGRKIGLTSILGEKYQRQINNSSLQMIPAEQGLSEIIDQLKSEADYLVLLSHATREETKALAAKFPQFNLVVTAGGAEEPPDHAKTIKGSEAKLIEVGHKGMHVVVLGLYNDPKQPIRYQRVPLDARFADSPEMKTVLSNYQTELETLGFSGLGLKAHAHPSGRKFVGAETCGECHTQAHAVWSKTPHSHATETLEKLTPHRHHDPECLSCHVTGWEPQKYFPFESGYLSLEKTPALVANGCENCHGPGAEHAAAEMGEIEVTDDKLATLREQMKLPLAEAEAKCIQCHDPDNSPGFKFKKYWEEVKHSGKD